MISIVMLWLNDMLMMIESGCFCFLMQVDVLFVLSVIFMLLLLGGVYYVLMVNGIVVFDYGVNDLIYVLNMGNVLDNLLQFILYGVDGNYNL